MKLFLESSTNKQSCKTRTELFKKLRLRSPIDKTEMEVKEAIFNCIPPSLGLLITLNLCKELQIWSVTHEAIHQELEKSATKKKKTQWLK